MSKLDLALTALEDMPAAALRQEWGRVYRTPAPNISAELLRLGIAYRLQEKALGSLPRASKRVLEQAAVNRPTGPVIKPGTRLIRDWQGRTISVLVEEDGYLFENRRFRSLSAIAREITGTAWSGPRFFGLTTEASHG